MKSTELLSRYAEMQVRCRCGNTFTTHAVLGQPLRVEMCSHCHPAYTGRQKATESGQRVRRFQQKYGL